MGTFAATNHVRPEARPAFDPAGLLGLAATPVFVVMASISATSPASMIVCSSVSAMMPVNDMALMYLLMSLFHLSPWLKRFSALWQRHQTSINPIQGD